MDYSHGLHSAGGVAGEAVTTKLDLDRVDLELSPEVGEPGWSVFTGCDGEDPKFVGFFLRKEVAELMLTVTNPEDGSLVYSRDGDTAVELAYLTDQGIVTANDYTIKDHAELHERIVRTRLGEGAK